ncbi:hypothetical protein [uncultured Methanolobus sp.]|uniref:hypothetical protein n=1 Tax=uncultured Methanolobus sp. TaxID=218300 RepID=UPI002AAB9919|nr:hypothetical protein [uncultured Methanolobus sp.]
MGNKINLGFMYALLIIAIITVMNVGNAAGNSSDLSDSFVHPGVGFEEVKKSNEYFVDAYGVIPEFENEEEQQEFAKKIKEVYSSIEDDEIAKDREIKRYIGRNDSITTNLMVETASKNNIDISNSTIPYWGDFIVSLSASKDEYIVVGWNIYQDYDPTTTTTLDEILKEENLTLPEFVEKSIDRETMNEIYEIYYQRGKEIGIENIPIVFKLDGPTISLSTTEVNTIEEDVVVSENDAETSHKASGIGIPIVVSLVILAFICSKRGF